MRPVVGRCRIEFPAAPIAFDDFVAALAVPGRPGIGCRAPCRCRRRGPDRASDCRRPALRHRRRTRPATSHRASPAVSVGPPSVWRANSARSAPRPARPTHSGDRRRAPRAATPSRSSSARSRRIRLRIGCCRGELSRDRGAFVPASRGVRTPDARRARAVSSSGRQRARAACDGSVSRSVAPRVWGAAPISRVSWPVFEPYRARIGERFFGRFFLRGIGMLPRDVG